MHGRMVCFEGISADLNALAGRKLPGKEDRDVNDQNPLRVAGALRLRQDGHGSSLHGLMPGRVSRALGVLSVLCKRHNGEWGDGVGEPGKRLG